MIPFYLGKLFTKSGASDDVCSKVCSVHFVLTDSSVLMHLQILTSLDRLVYQIVISAFPKVVTCNYLSL